MYDKTDLNICLVITVIIKNEYNGIISKHYNIRKIY